MESLINSIKGLNKKILIAVAAAVIIVMGLTLSTMHKTVVIAHDGQEVEVSTFSNTVGAILRKQGIEIREEDKVLPEINEKVDDGARIIISRAFQVQLVDQGEEKTILTAEESVFDLLKSLNIQLKDEDRIEPEVSTLLAPGSVVKIIRVSEEYLVENQEIPYQTVVKYSDSLEHGKSKVVQEGTKGLKEVKLRIVYEDGIEVGREIVDETVHQQAVNEIVEKGTLNYIVTSRGEVARYKQVLTMNATAYDAGFESTGKNPGDKYYGITRSGTKVRPGVVAVDPKVIPLGTKLYVESTDGTSSYGYASAEDTGSAIKGNKIDLFFESRSDALKFGRRTVKVYILE